ncbi:CubicO group peptidase, beta-lactamase class C family [Lutibacter agarilyticus]|uniref:CubicO group peptidase, beta-lactamase class C family n=2 Tax=Lutibacter agarilyticus TaxID=1109740 RepID=A0A238V795_9FLAO|nr:CubicO group peptidase, beta-lactamase class C family [Lutibacter agarilyticus]
MNNSIQPKYTIKILLLVFNLSVIICLGQSRTNMIFTQTFEDINTIKNTIIAGAKVVGEHNKAVFFDGVDDFISFDIPYLNSNNDFSISIWVAPTRYKIAATWVSKPNLNKSKSQFRYGFGWPANRNLNFTFYDNFWQDTSVQYTLPLNEWTHLVYTLSPKNKKGQLYINGDLKHEYELNGYMPSKDPVFLGLQWDDYIFYSGYIDEFSVFSEVISAEEIKKLYNVFTKTDKIDVKPKLSKKINNYTYTIPQKHNDQIKTGDIRKIACDYDSIFNIVKKQLNDSTANLESLLIYKENKLVLEEYFHGYTANTLHGVSSITKSFTSTLLGIAIDNGFIKNEEASLSFYYPNKNGIPCLDSITLKHVLNHKSGIEPLEIARSLRTKKDWVQQLLANQNECKIGEFKYHELSPEIVMHTIFKNSPMQDLNYVYNYLFEPLGIKQYYWLKDQTGTIDGGTGLVIRPRDMLKFGILYKDKGVFNGKRILSEEWVRRATSEEITDFKYNYFWWRFYKTVEGKNIYYYSATGFGGQNITIVPELDLVIVATNSASGAGLSPKNIIKNFIIPSFVYVER